MIVTSVQKYEYEIKITEGLCKDLSADPEYLAGRYDITGIVFRSQDNFGKLCLL